MNASVKDVMSTEVAAVHRDASFKELATRLRDQRVKAFPVLDDDGKVVGVVSEADLLTKEALDGIMPGMFRGVGHHRQLAKAQGVTAADLMTTPAVTIGPDEPVAHAARLMYARRVKQLPVTDAGRRLIGMVSRSDVLSVYDRPDAEISREISQDVILGKFLCDPARFSVTVSDGIVTIAGTPDTAEIGRELIFELERVDGVVAVRDELNYPVAAHHAPAPLF